MIIIGIDPGQNGGLAILNYQLPFETTLIRGEEIEEMKSVLSKIGNSEKAAHAFIEKAQAMPKQGVCSMFNYGRGFGFQEGFCAALKIPVTLVTPKSWMKIMHQGTNEGETKERSLEAATRLAPGMPFLPGKRSGKPHIGVVEAFLIAKYGERVLGILL